MAEDVNFDISPGMVKLLDSLLSKLKILYTNLD